eukprot:PhM_4_TR8861/c0_g1_i1/m.97565/K20093/ERCC6L, PICH; DNA excision repair protein ERCC-6-like
MTSKKDDDDVPPPPKTSVFGINQTPTLVSIVQNEVVWREYALGKEDRRWGRLMAYHHEKMVKLSTNVVAAAARRAEGTAGDDVNNDTTCELPLLPDIAQRLLPHQTHGVQWIHAVLSAPSASGGVLADEMGLGKTIQCAAYLGAAMRRGHHRAVLIVAPVTILDNWERELLEWAKLKQRDIVMLRSQSKKERANVASLVRDARRYGENLVVLTSLGIVTSDVDKWQGSMFDLVIIDEGHLIKNPSAKATVAARKIPSRKRLLLTGTPIMNNLTELYSVFQFVDPTVFSCNLAEFKRDVNRAIVDGHMRDATEGEKAASRKALDELKCRIAPYFLRRTKNEEMENVSETKDMLSSVKTEFVVWVQMTPHQLDLYRAFLRKPEVQIAMTRVECKRNVLCWLTSLKKLCDHTWLHMAKEQFLLAKATGENNDGNNTSNCNDHHEDDDDDDEDLKGVDEDGNPLPTRAMRGISGDETLSFGDIWQGSAKMQAAVTLLQHHLSRGERCLVFSRSVRLLDIFEYVLIHSEGKEREGADLKKGNIMRIDGSTKPCDRQPLVQAFNDADGEYRVCLLTTQVGGLGLTMTAASCVVLLDPSWNPAVDSQAIDRAHRMGQRRDVTVYRLITCGTVEEKMYRCQVFKTNLLTSAGGDKGGEQGTEAAAAFFTRMELRAMFALEATDLSETHAQLKSMLGNEVEAGDGRPEGLPYVTSNHSYVVSKAAAMKQDSAAADSQDATPTMQRAPTTRKASRRHMNDTPSSNLTVKLLQMQLEDTMFIGKKGEAQKQNIERQLKAAQQIQSCIKKASAAYLAPSSAPVKRDHPQQQPEPVAAPAPSRPEDDDLVSAMATLSVTPKPSTKTKTCSSPPVAKTTTADDDLKDDIALLTEDLAAVAITPLPASRAPAAPAPSAPVMLLEEDEENDENMVGETTPTQAAKTSTPSKSLRTPLGTNTTRNQQTPPSSSTVRWVSM